jgi:hypothetical protein
MIGKIFEFGKEIIGLIPTDEGKAKAKALLMDAENKAQNELTKRLEADMKSDSWLSKNIRPLSLAFLLVLYSVQCFYNHPSIEVTQELLKTVFSFYFLGRTGEKLFKKGK